MGFPASSSPLTTFATSRIDEPSNRTASSLAHVEHQTPGTLRSVRTIRPLPDSLVYSRLSESSNCKLTSRALSLSPDCCLPVMALARAGARHSKQERRIEGAYQRRITPLYAGTRSLEPLPKLPPSSYGIGKSRRTIQHVAGGDQQQIGSYYETAGLQHDRCHTILQLPDSLVHCRPPTPWRRNWSPLRHKRQGLRRLAPELSCSVI